MARGGFLGRIGRAIRNIVAPPPRPPERPEPPRVPERPPVEEPTSREFKDIWRDSRGKGSYRKHRGLFGKIADDMNLDHDDQLDVWESYVKHMTRSGPIRRQSPNNPFWRESGIDPSSFDWQAWRVSMGFTGKNRSRTT